MSSYSRSSGQFVIHSGSVQAHALADTTSHSGLARFVKRSAPVVADVATGGANVDLTVAQICGHDGLEVTGAGSYDLVLPTVADTVTHLKSLGIVDVTNVSWDLFIHNTATSTAEDFTTNTGWTIVSTIGTTAFPVNSETILRFHLSSEAAGTCTIISQVS